MGIEGLRARDGEIGDRDREKGMERWGQRDGEM